MRRKSKTETPESLPPDYESMPTKPAAWTWLVPCSLALGIYIPSLFNGFIRDDHTQIVDNPQVQSWAYLPRLLTTHLWSETKVGNDQTLFYRPLFSIWMLLVNTVGGLSPWVWHLSNILLHVAATYLVFVVCQRLLKNETASAIAALTFAVTPIHVDAVTWVSASNEILFVIFFLGSALLLIPESASVPLSRSRLLGSLVLYAAALFAKETAVAILPVLILLALYNFEEGKWRWHGTAALKSVAWYLATTLFYLVVRTAVVGRVGVETGKNSWQETIYSSPSVAVFYLGKLLFPIGLSGCYLTPLISAPTVGMWLTVAGILTGVALLAWIAVRYSPTIGLAGALIILPILPVLAGVRIYPRGDMTHDRYLYLPSVGLSILAGLLIRRWWSSSTSTRTALTTCSVVLAAVFSYLTFIQQEYYKDDFVFYQRTIDLYPTNGLALAYLGNLNMDRGRSDLAMAEFHRAHELDPDNPTLTLFLVRGLFDEHQYAEAEALIVPLLQMPNLEPMRKATILLSLANIKISMGKFADAEQLLGQVEQMYPNFPEAHWAHGVLLQKQGRIAEAQAQYLKEFQITGDREARKEAYALGKLLASTQPGLVTPTANSAGRSSAEQLPAPAVPSKSQ
jgi:protein O-mannosyl-transferase